MSYEGYDIVLCRQGHKSEVDCYEFPQYSGSQIPGEFSCGKIWTCWCGATAQWWTAIDLTNGIWCYGDKPPFNLETFEDNPHCPGCEYCDKGRIDGYIELEVATETCGYITIVKEKTYKIPEGVGHKVE